MADENLRLIAERQMTEVSAAATDPGLITSTRRIQEEAAQQPILDTVGDTFKTSILYNGFRMVRDNAPVILDRLAENGFAPKDAAGNFRKWDAVLGLQPDKPNWNKDEHADALLAGIPQDNWDDVLGYDDYNSAMRARGRIISSLERTSRLGQQKGAVSTLAIMATSMVDVDLPLMFMSSGAYGGAKIAGAAYKTARAAGVGVGMSTRIASSAELAYAGAITGGALGGAAMAVDETADWTRITDGILSGASTGGALGVFIRGDTAREIFKVRSALHESMASKDFAAMGRAAHGRAEEGALIDPEGIMPEGAPARPAAAQGPGPADYQDAGAALTSQWRNAPLDTPFGPVSPDAQDIIRRTSAWYNRSGMKAELEDIADTKWGKVMLGVWDTSSAAANAVGGVATRFVNSMGNDVMGLYRSKATSAKWLANTIFENASSFGRGIQSSSAATHMVNFEGAMEYRFRDYRPAMMRWAKRNNKTFSIMNKETGFAISDTGKTEFDRFVRENLNALDNGRAELGNPSKPLPNQDPDVLHATEVHAKHYEFALETAQGPRPDVTSIRGMETVQKSPGYVPQMYNGHAMVNAIRTGQVTRADIEAGMTTSYVNAGMPQEAAEIVAKANTGRALINQLDEDTSLVSLLTEDGREFLRERLIAENIVEEKVDMIMRALTGMAEERGLSSFAKHRNTLDLSTPVPNSSFTLLDFMDNDLEGIARNYRRKIAGQSALARKGIRSRMEWNKMKEAIHQEQLSVGETPIAADKLDAMVSDFWGGPGWGYSKLTGGVSKGVSPVWGVAKQIANLSLLQQLGWAQLMDSANSIASHGLRDFMEHSRAFAGLNDAIRKADDAVLDELAPLMGEIGMEHRAFAPHLMLDEVADKDMPDWFRGIRKVSSNMSHLASYTNGFNLVRKKQQQVEAVLLAAKVTKSIRDLNTRGGPLTRAQDQAIMRVRKDLGVDEWLEDYIYDRISDGTIQFSKVGNTEFVNRLNLDQWEPQAAADFASIMARGIHQNVQRSLAGETDVWSRTLGGDILTHLKRFPLTAIPKQMMRNARFMDDQLMYQFTYGLALSGLALTLRDAATGKLGERDIGERAMQAIGYSSMTGWIPMITDPAATMLGLDDMRIQQYGRHYEASIPTLSVANKLIRAPGATTKVLTGNANGDDWQSFLAIPFMRTAGLGEWMRKISD